MMVTSAVISQKSVDILTTLFLLLFSALLFSVLKIIEEE